VIYYRDNIRQLGALAAAACLTQEEAQQLQEIYRNYRICLHRFAMDARAPLVTPGDFKAERQFVTDIWQRELGDPID